MSVEGGMTGRGRGGRGPPFGNLSERKELRRPMVAVAPMPQVQKAAEELASRLQNIGMGQADDGKFNINAMEFVPKTSALSIAAPEFVPPMEDGEVWDSGQYEDSFVETPVGQSVTVLHNAMEQLTFEPGRFDSIARKLTDDLNLLVKDYDTLQNLAEIIAENAINEPNFRYTGARLCDHLSQHLTVIVEEATLRQILMQKCNREFKQRNQILEENPTRLRGFTLFLAELFQQLEIQVGDMRQRVQVLGDAIPQIIATLASDPNIENVKCVVQTLKCCGSVLEEEERLKVGATPQCDKMFGLLKKLSQDESLNEECVELLSGLTKLHSCNWGHSPSLPTSGSSQDLPGLGTFALDPVFYAPDGQPLTMEEYNFLQEYTGDEDSNFGDVQWSTGDDIPEGEGMGTEVEAAYEEFLRMQ